MSEEEKKAIENIKELVFGNIPEITIYDEDGYTMWNNDLETVLNLIEKQQRQLKQKENENDELLQNKESLLKKSNINKGEKHGKKI